MKYAAVAGVEHKWYKWYADNRNAVGVGSIDNLLEILKLLKQNGPSFGYHLTKCHLITKPELIPSTRGKIRDFDVANIDGFRVLGLIIG